MKTKTTYHRVYTAKRYVLWTISDKLQEKGDWKFLDILVFKNKGDHEAIQPQSYDELCEILKDVEQVYSFNQVETNLHGAIAYDIVINGEKSK